MKFTELAVPGAFLVEAEPHGDDRGSFARLYCPEEFAAAGIGFAPSQVNLSRNRTLHTLRGMHYQAPPMAEAKLVRCTAGRVWDVALDLRPGAGFGRWCAVELDAGAVNAVFLPEGVAHGFLTLTPGADVLYQMGRMFEPGHGRGVRWNDPSFGIDWPAPPEVISERDAGWPDWAREV